MVRGRLENTASRIIGCINTFPLELALTSIWLIKTIASAFSFLLLVILKEIRPQKNPAFNEQKYFRVD